MERSGIFGKYGSAAVIAIAISSSVLCLGEDVNDAEFAALQSDANRTFTEQVKPFVDSYCTRCHGQDRQKGGVNFGPALKNPGESASRAGWKRAIAAVKSHDMPPEDAKQPSDEDRDKFLLGLGKIKFLSSKDPGPFVIRRLTKMEYANTLHDLLGVSPSVADELPEDVIGEGYLNTVSPMQLEQYLAIANEVLDRVLADKDAPPSRWRKIISGDEPSPGDNGKATARMVAASLAREAYRRPPSEAELDVLIHVFDLAVENKKTHAEALRLMAKAILVSPQFLFITPAKEIESGDTFVSLDDYQLASRLSYLLWATMPDAELSALAERGQLQKPEVLTAQVTRMLKDRRSRALFDGFGAQWLRLGELKTKTFDAEKFPQMNTEMRHAMYEEARLFFENVVRENGSIVGLLNSDYTFLNGTLAKLYGMDKEISGTAWRKVKLTDANRGGILGMPGVLAVTSFPDRTSPVKRGVWVLEQVLGEHVPPPPPNVPALEKQNKQTVASLTVRQRTELHQKEVACANCHKILDPIGFGLENFDAIGRWRDRDDSGGAIDAAGELPGGKRFSTPKELKAIMAAREADLARNLTQKLLAYALCRQLEGYDEIVVDRMVATIATGGYRMQDLIIEIVTSFPFTHRRVEVSKLASSHEK